jgi:putative DNA primase/helicase
MITNDIPKQLRKQKYRFILVEAKGKKPIETRWTDNNNYDFENSKLKNHKGNYGIIGGYGDLIILDFDDSETEQKLRHYLPATFIVETGTGGKHYYYTTNKADSYKIRRTGKEEKTLIDIQGVGKQVIGPGSTHPNGNKYKVFNDEKIAGLDNIKLKTILLEHLEPNELPKAWLKDLRISKGSNEIDEIKNKLSVAQLLREEGYNPSSSMLCPFHNDKTESAGVFDNGDKFNCFACNVGGDVIAIYQELKKTDFKTTIKELTDKLGIKPKNKLLFNQYGNPLLKVINDYHDKQPFLLTEKGLFYIWNKESKAYEIKDELNLIVDLLDEGDSIQGEVYKGHIQTSLKNCFHIIGRKHFNTLNKTGPDLIQFKNGVWDLKNKILHPDNPAYFSVNTIPWNLGDSEETPIIDKLFTEWVGEEWKATLYELLAYSLYRKNQIHSNFFLMGSGRNGKTSYLNLLRKFLGTHNTSVVDFDDLCNNRFGTAKIYKKLAGLIYETNFNVLKHTDKLKSLSGGDPIEYEFKNKNSFTEDNYTKIVISTNILPATLDRTEAFYRRCLVIDFPNKFPEGKDIIEKIPLIEFENLARKCINILPIILERGTITNQGTIEERTQRYEDRSNPLAKFCKEEVEFSSEGHIFGWEFYERFLAYCKLNGYRTRSKSEIYEGLQIEYDDIEKLKRTNQEGKQYPAFIGINWKGKSVKSVKSTILNQPLYIEERVETTDIVDSMDFREGKQETPATNNVNNGNKEIVNISNTPNILTLQDLKAHLKKAKKLGVEEILNLLPKDWGDSKKKECLDSWIEKLMLTGSVYEQPKFTYRWID